MTQEEKKVSRRDFARQAAIFSVVVPMAAVPSLEACVPPRVVSVTDDQQLPKLPVDFPTLSEQSRAEVEQRYEMILKQYSGRFSADQKADLRRLCFLAQPSLDKLRGFSIQNGASPALYLKPTVEREKKPTKTTTAPAVAAKKS